MRVRMALLGRPTAGSSLTEDAEAQDVIPLNSTTVMENLMMQVIQTPLSVSPTQRTFFPRKGSKQKRMLELQHADLALSVTKKIKKRDGGIPRQDKARFRNLCVQAKYLEGEQDSLVKKDFLEFIYKSPALGDYLEESGDLEQRFSTE
ncbi:hypothetical protein ACFX1T_022514 [Malus domestica]